MSGTKAGGIKAAQTNKLRHGADFYGRIGAKGGANGHTGGFAANVSCNCPEFILEHQVRECAGKKGGRKSKRGRYAHPD